MRVKKLLSSILAICMILSTMGTAVFAVEEPEAPVLDMIAAVSDEYPTENWIDSADTSWYTEGETYYTISSATELAGLAKLVSDGTAFCDKNFNSVTITLDADIDLDGKMWTPIGGGEKNNTFAGIFDGGNHKISNVTVISSYGNVGLFGRCAMNADFGLSAEVKNFTIENAVIKASGKDAVGAAIGYGHTELKVDNVNVTGVIDVLGYRGVAAVVGKGYADIYNCTVKAEGTIASQFWCAGGILGHSDENCNEILNCKVIAVGDGLTIDGGAYNGAGGIAGYITSGSTVKDAAIEGIVVTGDSYYYGGYACGNEYTAENVKVSNVKLMAGGNEVTDSHDAEAVEVCVAEVDGEYYADIVTALKAIKANSVFNLLADVTITEDWDCRNNGAKILVPVTINGNGHTLKFTGKVDDKNWNTVFRFEDDAIVKDLTIDASEASLIQRGISAKGNITVDNFTFIGNGTSAKYGVIFGEGSGENIGNITANITGSSFENCSYGVSDNRNGQDVKTVTVSDSTFTNAKVLLSAKETLTFTNNEVEGGSVTITSYSDVTELAVTATGNTLDETATNYIVADVIETDSEEFDLPVADINGKKFISVAEAAKSVVAGETATIKITDNVSDENVIVNGNVTIVNGAASTYALKSNATTLNNVVFTVESGAGLSLDGFNVTGLSYIYAKTPESISVTNCDIDVTTVEVSGTNCPPGFVLFSSNNGGSVEFTFTNNTLLAAPDATEDWYTYSHGIAGWNSIEKATITGNTFGSAEDPLGAAAVKLMNFVEGADVEVSNNTFYVNSKDSTWGPDAIQFYQNNSRANNYTATINDNDFYVDDATAAIGINTNAMGKPVDNAGGGHVAIGSDNTVNGEAISISNVIVFGNGINDEAYTRGYVGVGVEFDANGKIIGGEFSEYSLGLEDALADGYATETDVAGNLNIVEETLLVDEIKVEFAPASEAEGEKVYNINLTAGGDVINRLNSADLTFLFSQIEGNNEYEIVASNSEVAINPVDNSKVRYEFHYNGKTDVATDTNATITLGQVKFTGYGKFSFVVDVNANDTNAAHATKLFDNIVDTFIPNGNAANGEGILDVSDKTITDVEIAVPVRTLTINLDFPNAVEDNKIAYQDMKVEITGTIDGVNQTVTYALGTDGVYAMANGDYVVEENRLILNNAYTVTVSGAGYRTARYTVTMTTDKTLRFWNNVMDEAQVVEVGKDSSIAKVTFLAGDIVKDNNINIYDLSAVVSYFGSVSTTENGYAKYDLNRDGVIDSKDVAYVLVSWNN